MQKGHCHGRLAIRSLAGDMMRRVLILFAMAMAASGAVAAEIREVPGSAIGSNPGNLQMFQYIPENLHATPALVVVLHGCKQNAVDYGNGAGWRQLADQWGFALLLPQQSPGNNPDHCFNWFNGDEAFDFFWPGSDQDRDRGEALSIRQMVDLMKTRYGVDPHRIYVTGLSAGGAMTAVMLATYPDVFAGGAVIAGVPYKCTTNSWEALLSCGVDITNQGIFPTKNLTPVQWGSRVRNASSYHGPWPTVSIWQSTDDKTVNPDNARELLDQWTNVHGIGKVMVQDKVKGFTHEMYRNATGAVMVERYLLTGLGHGTPIDPGHGADQCGTAGDFILAGKICSSYYIGKFWGLDRVP
jgi:poly(hydroxyalkanoate) depolymerase family esterase